MHFFDYWIQSIDIQINRFPNNNKNKNDHEEKSDAPHALNQIRHKSDADCVEMICACLSFVVLKRRTNEKTRKIDFD